MVLYIFQLTVVYMVEMVETLKLKLLEEAVLGTFSFVTMKPGHVSTKSLNLYRCP
jgi:hypothetical protein